MVISYFYIILIFQCFWALGACFEVTLALIVMPTLGWHWLLALSTGPLLAFAIICPVSIIHVVFCVNFKSMLGECEQNISHIIKRVNKR